LNIAGIAKVSGELRQCDLNPEKYFFYFTEMKEIRIYRRRPPKQNGPNLGIFLLVLSLFVSESSQAVLSDGQTMQLLTNSSAMLSKKAIPVQP
jgi:hypothetical protein